MSYSNGGLGLINIPLAPDTLPATALPTPLAPSLPAWELAAGNRRMWGSPGAGAEVEFGTIGDEAVLNRMMVRLVELWAVNPGDIDTGVPGDPNKPGRRTMTAKRTINDWAGYEQFHIRENGPFVQGWYAYWCRVDHDVATWPSGFEMTMPTSGGVAVNVSKTMYERLRLGQMWTQDAQERQTFFGGDWLFKGLMAERLRQMGYLDAVSNVSAAEGGAMWNAIHNYVAEMLSLPEASLRLYWPRVNVGQGVPWAFTWGEKRQSEGYWTRDNDQIVIQLAVVKTILDGVSARNTAGRAAEVAAALRGATIRPPIIGLPSTPVRPVIPVGMPLVMASTQPSIVMAALRRITS